ncbi:hypothetical protein [Burkholderia sp. MSMB0856]|uniref:hypothetical protein n=1 Tax=Burkholderia sp. MSMB0856 TaxID=1637869 RepID=UPI000ACB83D6|nr:hypothetical protein [Burkholderia sp. MSMB0856]
MGKRKWSFKWLGKSFLMVILYVLASNGAAAYSLELAPLSNGYSNCSWRDNGDGTSTVGVMISYKEASGNTGSSSFTSRGVLIYTYDKNGGVGPSAAAAKFVMLNEEQNSNAYVGSGYVMYHGATTNGDWKKETPLTANLKIVFDNAYLREWPAITVRAGNFTRGNDVGEVRGGAYVGPGTSQSCSVVDPKMPPPPPISIEMTAPDWNLGDLPEGDGEKTFSNTTDQLCFTYVGAAVSGRQFIVTASNSNGIAQNRYRLKHVNDASQLVPYTISLDAGTSILNLPNTGNVALSLDSSGRTCFVPTFKTSVDRLLKEGDYSDVLTFTVVTKS